MKIVEIDWVDSVGLIPVWESRDVGPLVPSRFLTVGYLWESTKDYITVAQSFHAEQVGRRFSIPRGCIKKMKIIRR